MSFKMGIAGFILSVLATITLTTEAQAQFGYGMAPAMQGCGYPMAMAPGASSANDGIKEAQQAIKDAKRQLQTKKNEKKRLDRDVEKYEKDITDTIETGYADFVLQHIQNGRSCAEYGIRPRGRMPQSEEPPVIDGRVGGQTVTGTPPPPAAPGRTPDDDDGEIAGPPPAQQPSAQVSRRPSARYQDTAPFTLNEWAGICGRGGGVSPVVCSQYRGTSGGRKSSSLCARAIPLYRTAYAKAQKLQDEIESFDRTMDRLNDDLKDAKQAAIDDRKALTEGGICIECMQRSGGYAYQQQSPNYLNLALGVGMGLAGMYAGYQTNKTIAQYNSNIGMPTQQAPLYGLGYGLPFFQAGLQSMGGGVYGGVGGGMGMGAFGCAPTMGGYGNGFMNNPYAMGGMPMGGGMFMPGYGMNGMGGMGMPGMMGMGGMPGMMNPYGMMGMGMPGMGLGGGLGMGMPGMMNPYGMGGMGMPGMMGMGMPGMGLGGGLGMGMPGMMGMNPYGMGGLGMPGMGLGGGLGVGYNPYGMMGMPGMMGLGGMAGNPMAMQMQQLQMQAYQQQMQSQQAAMQDAMNRQRAVAGLQSEMYTLMQRIQQAQMGIGIGTTGSYLGGTTGTGIYSGSGAITGGISGGAGYLQPYGVATPYTPYYGTGTTATTPLTGR